MNDNLISDCEHCFALCCVALPYGKSADFPINKEGGEPYGNICNDNQCSIHNHLLKKGFKGCVSFECFGAGQHVSQQIYGGQDWRQNGGIAKQMFAVFPIIHQLNEMLYYLNQSLCLDETKAYRNELKEIYELTYRLTGLPPDDILEVDLVQHRFTVNEYLLRISDSVRNEINHEKKHKKADYIAANLKYAKMAGINLRGKLCIAADFSHADLRRVDFLGADLRDAKLHSADLTDCIFLTQSQVNAAKGNIDTTLPDYVQRPRHWS
ncbi:pentapeptide repeat protein [Cytobacillus horneckiae]|uniref:pentapeptide repeat-containing protein n=1 Tax=Cytobacillus horneckiae TaxID=549687 RepID=UPI0019CF6C6F|nr:pentapeptide repeat-containing protein [Cytobacillus horneckiae]MBN6885856.1 pentapeptide repeat-containing protein [Cytobacillus horneckiae]